MSFYRRRLPHWHPPGASLFVTWRLFGSLPPHRAFPNVASGKAFDAMDRLLDESRTEPQLLRQTEIAALVVEAILYAETPLERFDLHAYVVMPNHVHLLITPKAGLPELLRSLKGITARRANRALRRAGQPFWQEESFDHWVRDESEFTRIARYIERNPVRAGLAATPEEYPWSSGAVRQNRAPVA